MGETRQYVLVDTVNVDKVYQYCKYTCVCWRAIGETKSKKNSMYTIVYCIVLLATTLSLQPVQCRLGEAIENTSMYVLQWICTSVM